jgi:hypothetical protein
MAAQPLPQNIIFTLHVHVRMRDPEGRLTRLGVMIAHGDRHLWEQHAFLPHEATDDVTVRAMTDAMVARLHRALGLGVPFAPPHPYFQEYHTIPEAVNPNPLVVVLQDKLRRLEDRVYR